MTINFPTGALFIDPRTNQKLAGAQLSFFFSGTTSFISVYKDAGLTTFWTQPLVADANGNFPPNIYMNPVSPSKAAVQLANSLGVVQWTVDPYFIPYAITLDSPIIEYADASFEIKIPTPPFAVPTLVVANIPGAVALRIIGGGNIPGGTIEPAWTVNNLTTGTQAASFAPATNKPGPASSTLAKWLPILSNGVTYFAPCFT